MSTNAIQLTFANQVLNQANLDKEIKVPERLRKLRLKHGFSMDKVAQLIGVKRQTYCGYEAAPDKKYHRSPSYDNLMKLADLYNVSTDYLIGLTDNPAPRVAVLDVMEVLEKDRSIDKNTRQFIASMLKQVIDQHAIAAV